MSSHVEGYIMALQEQEINTRDSLTKKEKNLKRKQEMNNPCRLCRKNVETLYHVTTGCPAVSLSLYLNICHNAIAKIIFENIINENENTMQKIFKDPEPITVFRDLEIWWDKPVSLPRKIPHNCPDNKIWDKKTLSCTIIDVSVPLDLNIEKKNQDKSNDYMLLVGELQQLYSTYKYTIAPVIIGAFGTVTNELKENLQMLGFSGVKSDQIIRAIQKRALIGTMKI